MIKNILEQLLDEIKESNRLKRYEIAVKTYEIEFNGELGCAASQKVKRLRSKLAKPR